MRYRVILACLLLLALGLFSWTSPVRADDGPDNELIVQIHRIARNTDKAASQARALSWAAVALGVVNAAILAAVAAKLLGHDLPSVGALDPRIVLIRRRQRAIARDLATLNDRLEMYLQMTDEGRKGLAEALQAISGRARAASAEIDQVLPPEPPPMAG